ncbi:hypothetical protein [Streptomyces angustmyceticus]|uniref:hypothetical protein n=1 Tax=Streptomyces angustmyceticus TaxID=285578 RepID=UPI0021B000E4|nr:hypothetical protein [Streptomyces angustmyceticus]
MVGEMFVGAVAGVFVVAVGVGRVAVWVVVCAELVGRVGVVAVGLVRTWVEVCAEGAVRRLVAGELVVGLLVRCSGWGGRVVTAGGGELVGVEGMRVGTARGTTSGAGEVGDVAMRRCTAGAEDDDGACAWAGARARAGARVGAEVGAGAEVGVAAKIGAAAEVRWTGRG